MKHKEWRVLVSAYHDGELNEEEQAMVERHLAECAECAAALEDYRRLRESVQALPKGEPSRQLWLRVQEQLPTRRQQPRPRWQRFLPLASVLAMLLVALTVVLSQQLQWVGPTAQDLSAQGSPVPEAQENGFGQEPQRAAAPTAAHSVSAEDAIASTHAPVAPEVVPAGIPPCPGQALALELSDLAIQQEKERSSPRLTGVVYDAEGRPLPQSTLIFSGTADWQGVAVTDKLGGFALDLPSEGRYQLILALDVEDKAGLLYEGRVGEEATWTEMDLPESGRCLAPLTLDLPALSLGPRDVAFLTLRLK
ncbi:MAG: zf-HC2 domain-containing protein [Chloroflexia bacterium]|nr:zf-HC2 domain-containing protein [Chloroflexia bacterium]